MKRIFEILRELRLITGVSQEHLAEKIGCSRLSLTYYENNQSRPRRPILEKWLSALSEEILLYADTHKTEGNDVEAVRKRSKKSKGKEVKGDEQEI